MRLHLKEDYKGEEFFTIENGVLVKCDGDATGEIEIPDGVKEIGKFAFSNCSKIISITIPTSVTNIRDMAFFNCRNLTSINIPDSVTSLGNGVFYQCASLTSVKIPNSVTSIKQDTFHMCENLTTVIIPDSVTSIGKYAFHWCESLTSITIPDSVTSIGSLAFWKSNLKSIVLPKALSSKESLLDIFGLDLCERGIIVNGEFFQDIPKPVGRNSPVKKKSKKKSQLAKISKSVADKTISIIQSFIDDCLNGNLGGKYGSGSKYSTGEYSMDDESDVFNIFDISVGYYTMDEGGNLDENIDYSESVNSAASISKIAKGIVEDCEYYAEQEGQSVGAYLEITDDEGDFVRWADNKELLYST